MVVLPKDITKHIKSFIPRDDSFKSQTADIIKEHMLFMEDANDRMLNTRCFNSPPISLLNNFPDFILSRRGKWILRGWYVRRKYHFLKDNNFNMYNYIINVMRKEIVLLLFIFHALHFIQRNYLSKCFKEEENIILATTSNFFNETL